MPVYKSVIESNEFSLLHDISHTLSSSLNLQDSVSTIFEMLNTRFGFMKAILTIVNPVTFSVNLKVTYGIKPEEIESQLFKKWEEITLKVLESKQPVVIPHLTEETSFLGEHEDVTLSDDSFVCLPLVLKDERFGTLSIDLPFSDEEKLDDVTKLLTIVSLMIAQEVRLKRLLDQEKEALRLENQKLKNELKEKYQIDNMIGKSGVMVDVYENVQQVASSNATVLVRGESGTGKELVAHAIHFLSPRAKGPFIRINCGAIPESLIESELFGHEKGAFTDAVEMKIGKVEAADGGTLFLDEIAELNPQMQVKLLRVLQDREISKVGGLEVKRVNVRLIAATNKDLEAEMELGKIREDFYYRLNVFPILLPPLRERRTDILLLAEHFLDKYTAENNKEINRFSSAVIDVLYSYSWPGNVRELENCIERSVIVCKGDTIQPTHLPPSLQRADIKILPNTLSDTQLSFKELVNQFEKKVLEDALHRCHGNVSSAARELDTTSRILGYKIKQLKISLDDIKIVPNLD